MGFILGLSIVAILFALKFIFGMTTWLVILAVVAFLVGLFIVLGKGHRAFKTGTNTDVVAYVFVFAVALAIMVPRLKSSFEENADISLPLEQLTEIEKYNSFISRAFYV